MIAITLFNELTNTLKDLGFKEINSMHCVMANHAAIVLFYVDDIIFLFRESMRPQVMRIIAKLQENTLFTHSQRPIGS